MKSILALALACVSSPLLARVQTPAPADTPAKTSSGVTYVQPKAWTAATNGAVTVLTPPEGNLSVAFVEVGPAANAQAAVDRAWSLYRPGPKPVQRLATPAAPRDGWEERVAFSYETPPNAKQVASAMAMHRGADWTVMIEAGAQSTSDKRQAAAGLLAQTVRPAGYARESFAGRTAHRLTPNRVELMRAFVEQSLRELEVPGAGVALIEGGKVVWAGGVGVKRLGSPEPVDAHSKFMIASNTKGLSTLLLSTLADQGKLRWDQPVTQLYPAFRLGGDDTTRATLVRHLVCACTGLPRKDLAFVLVSPDAPAIGTFQQLAATEPTSGFGELFQYNNLMASAAGYLGGHLLYPRMELGAAYDRAMKERIFAPLGMHDTSFTNAKQMTGDWARPYGRDVDGRVVELSNDFNDTIRPYRPAGGAWSSAADMARYVQLELGRGTLDGKRIVSETNILERRKPGVLVGEDKYYGMGLFNEVDWGVHVVDHGGTLQGYRSNWFALPDAGIGAVILTNADDGAALTAPFLRRLLELVYDGRPEAAADVTAAAARAKAAARVRRARLTVPGDPAVLRGLAQRYSTPEIGELTIRRQDGQTWMHAGSIDSPLATRTNADGSVSVVTAGPGAIGVEAVVGGTAGARTLTVRDSQHEYIFAEVK